MHFCFIDESGDSQAILNPTHNVQPLLVISGLFVDGSKIKQLTHEFLLLKRTFFPNKFINLAHNLDALTHEIKGDALRKIIRDNSFTSPQVKAVLHYLDEILMLLWKYDVKLTARIWIKQFKNPLTDKSIYTITTQRLCQKFQSYLDTQNSEGLIVADYRDPARNSYVAHSIFTQKNKLSGDRFPRVIEIPTFAISNNHAMIQIADLLSTTLLFPMAAQVYCSGYVANSFINPNFEKLRRHYKKRLRKLQYHFTDSVGKIHWGISVRDAHGNKESKLLFA